MPLLTPRFNPPAKVGVGKDGLPDYVVATRGDKYNFVPPYGKKLAVFLGEERLYFIVEADRKRGWAIGLHYEVIRDEHGRVGYRVLARDEDGIAQHRFYQGRIIFRLIPDGG